MKKGEQLYEKLGEVNEKYVDEAENYAVKSAETVTGKNRSAERKSEMERVEGVVRLPERRRRFLPAAIAACFAVTAISLPVIFYRNSANVPSSDIPEVTDTDTVSEENNQNTDSNTPEENNQFLPSSIYEMNKQTNEYELVYRSEPLDYEVCDNTDDDEFENPDIYSWSVETALSEISDYFMEQNNLETRNDGFEIFRKGGYELYLTTDRDIQEHLDSKYADWYFFPEALNEYGDPVQSTFVVMDYTGHILGVEGRLGVKEINFGYNYAYNGGRQPGSAITPVTAYGYAIENNLLTYSSYCDDKFLPSGTYAGLEEWPLNFDGTPSGGRYPLWVFFRNSICTLPAQIVYNNGSNIIQDVFDFTTQKLHLELDSEKDADYGALCTGSTYTGPGIINLANAYMPYGNGGKYYRASIISKCVNQADEVIIDNENREGEQAVSEETAFIMNKLLTDVITSGTGHSAQLENTVCAGKTGTDDEWQDLTFVGMTPDYLSALWVGYDSGENRWVIESTNSARIWKNVFGDYADEHVTVNSFPECDTVSCEKYCAVTGERASEGCPEPDNSHILGYFKPDDPYCDGQH